MSKKLWFKAKTYGWGWTPCSWEGWLCIVLFLAFIVWNFRRLDSVSHSASDTLINFVPQTLIAIFLLFVISYMKGEKLGWRWGNKKD